MRMILASLALVGAMMPAATAANVVQQDERGFRIIHIVETDASPEELWRTLVQPARWWNPVHSYAGEAGNFSLETVPGGCFCEIADTLSVEHARVIYAEPGVRLRMHGALGPLQQDAVTGILTFALRERAGGGTTISIEYSVSGNFRSAVGTIAPAVDAVITDQGDRLAKAALNAPSVPRKPLAIDQAPAADARGKEAEVAPEGVVDEEGDNGFGEAFGDTPEPKF